VAEVVGLAAVVGEEVHGIVGSDVLRMIADEFCPTSLVSVLTKRGII
jgi:hypothetical protein